MLVLSLGGTLLGAFLFRLQYGSIQLDGALDSANFNLVYGILLSSTFLLAIFMTKQKARRVQEKQRYLEKAYADSKAEFSKVLQYSEEVLGEMIQTKGLLNKAAIEYVHHVIYRIGDYMELHVAEITIDKLLQDVKATLKLKNSSERPRLVVEKMTDVGSLWWMDRKSKNCS